ncbi:hypothetical protein WDW86_21445 [Bdellovibrionota bacterium FG-2]
MTKNHSGPPPVILLLQDALFFSVAAFSHGPALYSCFRLFTEAEARGVSMWAVLPFSLVVYPLVTLFILCGLDRLIPRVPEGRHKLGGRIFIFWGLHLIIYRAARLPPLTWLVRYSNVLRFVWLNGLGAKVSFRAQLSGDVNVLDHRPLAIGAGAVIGSETLISTHIVMGDSLRVGAVTVAAGALVGGRCVLGPGSTVGAGATVMLGAEVGMGSTIGPGALLRAHCVVDSKVDVGAGATLEAFTYVPPKTIIPAGERWGGIPARRLSEASLETQ